MTPSCGCTKVVTLDGVDLSFGGYQLAPGAKEVIQAQIDTEGRLGAQQFQMIIEARGDDSHDASHLVADIFMEVSPGGWRVSPASIEFGDVKKNTTHKAVVIIFDTANSSKSPWDIEELHASNSNRVFATLTQIPNDEKTNGNYTINENGFKPRWKLTVEYKVPTETTISTVHDSISLAPSDAKLPHILIPITGTLPDSLFTISPRTISVSKGMIGREVQRKIRIKTNRNIEFNLKILNSPDYLDVEAKNLNSNISELIVTFDLKEDFDISNVNDSIVISVDDQTTFTIPVRSYGRATKDRQKTRERTQKAGKK